MRLGYQIQATTLVVVVVVVAGVGAKLLLSFPCV
jgi:hypothetical protein